MDKELLKKIAQYVRGNMKIPKQISGYEEKDVLMAVNDMISKKIIVFGKAIKYSPKDGNYEIKKGNAIPIENGEEIDVATLSEMLFEKEYGTKWF